MVKRNLRSIFARVAAGIGIALTAASGVSAEQRATPAPQAATSTAFDVSPYTGILQSGKPADYGVKVDSDVSSSFVREAGRKAAAGKDVVNAELIGRLTNYNVDFKRGGDQASASAYDISWVSRGIFHRAAYSIATNGWTAGQLAAQDAEIKSLAKNLGAPETVLRVAAGQFEENLKNLTSQGLAGDKTLDTRVLQQAFGMLSGEEEKALQSALDKHADATNIPRPLMRKMATDYAEAVRTAAAAAQDEGVAKLRTAAGTTSRINGGEVDVPDWPENADGKYRVLYMQDNDRPKLAPPGTVSLWEFLAALHEGEHLTQLQGSEIDADTPVLQYLDQAGEKKVKEYYLQWRNVSSFRSGPEDGWHHDTATYLRVMGQTGKSIDTAALAAEKAGLLAKIDAKLDGRCIAGSPDYCSPDSAKTGDIMGAVQEILREDKTLTAIQRAEAESYLADAKAMGYDANPQFPRKAPAAKPAAPQVAVPKS